MGWFSDKLLSVVMDKKARDRLEQEMELNKTWNKLPQDVREELDRLAKAQAEGKLPPRPDGSKDHRSEARQALDSAADKLGQRQATPEREALIRQAMSIRNEQQKIFANLTDEERDKLTAMALKAFMGEGGSKH